MTTSLRLRRKNHVKSPMAVKSIVSGFLAVAIVSSESQQRKLNPDESGFFRIRGSSALRVEAGKGSVADDMWSGVHIVSCPQAELWEELAHGGPVNLGFCRSLGVSFDPPSTESPQSKDIDALELERLAQGMKELNKDECGLYEKDGAPNWRTVWIMRMWLGAIQLRCRAVDRTQIPVEQDEEEELEMSPNREIKLRIPVKMVMREAGPVVVYAPTSASKKKISGPFLNWIEKFSNEVVKKVNARSFLAGVLKNHLLLDRYEVKTGTKGGKTVPVIKKKDEADWFPAFKLWIAELETEEVSQEDVRKQVSEAFNLLKEEEEEQKKGEKKTQKEKKAAPAGKEEEKAAAGDDVVCSMNAHRALLAWLEGREGSFVKTNDRKRRDTLFALVSPDTTPLVDDLKLVRDEFGNHGKRWDHLGAELASCIITEEDLSLLHRFEKLLVNEGEESKKLAELCQKKIDAGGKALEKTLGSTQEIAAGGKKLPLPHKEWIARALRNSQTM